MRGGARASDINSSDIGFGFVSGTNNSDDYVDDVFAYIYSYPYAYYWSR